MERSSTRYPDASARTRQARTLTDVPPDGFQLRDGLLTVEDEKEVLAKIESLEFERHPFRGVIPRRSIAFFGWDYRYAGRGVATGTPFPKWLESLRGICADAFQQEALVFDQAIVTHYPPGAGIGWHCDAPAFGATILGLSLLAPCSFRLRHGAMPLEYRVVLPPRSAYVLSGAARTAWQHHIPAVRSTRYSFTFRRVLQGGGDRRAGSLRS